MHSLNRSYQIAAEGLSKKVIILSQENADGLEERKSLIAEQISSRLRVGEIEQHLSSNRAIRLRDMHENELLKIEIEHLRSTAREESHSNIAAQKNVLEKILQMENANSEMLNFKYTISSQVEEIISLSKEVIVVREKNKCLLEHVQKIESVLTVCAEQNNALKRDVAKMRNMLNRAPRLSRLDAAALRRNETLPNIAATEMEGGGGGRRSDREREGDRRQAVALRNTSSFSPSFSPPVSQELSCTMPASSSSSSSLSHSNPHSHSLSHSLSSYNPSYSESTSLPCSPFNPFHSASFTSSFRNEVVDGSVISSSAFMHQNDGNSVGTYDIAARAAHSISGNNQFYSSINSISEKKRNSEKNKSNNNNDSDDRNDSYMDIEGTYLGREKERDKKREKQNKSLHVRNSREGSATNEERGSVRGRAVRCVRTLNDPTRRSLFVGAGLGLRKEQYSMTDFSAAVHQHQVKTND